MGDNAVNESIEIPIETDTRDVSSENNAFQKAIQELGEAIFLNYEDKTSNLTTKNRLGMIKIETLNDFMERRYGFRYTELDVIVKQQKNIVISVKGFGIMKFIEALNAIKADFTQQEIPISYMQKLMRR